MLFFLVSAPALYFSIKFNVIFDKSMIRNVLETDVNEALDLLSTPFILTNIVMGIIPAWLVWKSPVTYTRSVKWFSLNLILIPLVFALSFVWTLPFYGEISSFIRVKRTEVLLSFLPSAPLHSLYKNLRDNFQERNIIKEVIDQDASRKTTSKKPLALVVMIGETARHKSFKIKQPATERYKPLLNLKNLIYFNNAWSCGTNTVDSVPCMVSTFGKEQYRSSYLKKYENIFELIHRLGIDFMWIKNNHCKHVCDQLPHMRVNSENSASYGHEGEFYDLALVNLLKQQLENTTKDKVIVLHQLGSHGPAYFKRIPEEFELYQPSCQSINFGDCSDDEIVNAYNNTIYYTKHVIGKTIEQLQKLSDTHQVVFIYMSDHGESTGEQGYYLHGMPYFMAPEVQTHIPALIWLSEGYVADKGIDMECLKSTATEHISHDNLSHTVLGVMGINSKVYEKNLDLIDSCRSL